jgi:hypothetical protein
VTHLGRWGDLLPARGFSRSRMGPNEEVALRGARWVAADGIQVISSYVDAQLPGQPDGMTGPQWHLSVTVRDGRSLRRPTDIEMRRAIDAFGMPAWEEDNHHPGAARHLWCPRDERYRTACECKLTETVIVEADGYEWTNPTDGPCRGCEHERLFLWRLCPIHGQRSACGPIPCPPVGSL